MHTVFPTSCYAEYPFDPYARVTFRTGHGARADEATRLFALVAKSGGDAAWDRWAVADRAARAHSWEGTDRMVGDYESTIDHVWHVMELAGWDHRFVTGGRAVWCKGNRTIDAWVVADCIPWGDDPTVFARIDQLA